MFKIGNLYRVRLYSPKYNMGDVEVFKNVIVEMINEEESSSGNLKLISGGEKTIFRPGDTLWFKHEVLLPYKRDYKYSDLLNKL